MARARIPPGLAADFRTYPHSAQAGSRYHCGHFLHCTEIEKPCATTAVLLIACPDRKGLVAAVAEFLYRHNANILHADQHQDAGAACS